jgi:purine-cytosine permease-like protein
MKTSSSVESLAPLRVSYTDDPRVIAASATEDYAGHVVPLSARSGKWSLTMAWWSVVSALFWLYISVAVTQQVGSKNAIIGIVLAVILFGALNIVMSREAIRRGITVSMVSRGIFGGVGATIVTLLFGAMAIYYAVFEGSIIAVALKNFFAPESDIRIWYFVVVVYALPLVIGGVQAWLDKLNGVLLPVYVIGLAVIIIGAGQQHGFSTNFLTIPAPHETSVPGWLWAMCLYLGNTVQAMFTVDFARFGKREDIKFHRTVSFGWFYFSLIFLANGLVGIFLMSTIFPGLSASEQGIAQAFLSVGGWFGLLIIIVSQTRINTANYYLASTNIDAFIAHVLGVRWPRIIAVGVSGAIVYALMLTDVFSYLLTAMAWQGVAVTSWVAIVLTHLFLRRKDGAEGADIEFRPGRVKRVMAGTWAIILASAVGISLFEFGTEGSWYVLTAPLITLIVASAFYAIALNVRSYDSMKMKRAHDPRDEVDDIWSTRIECHVCERSYTALEMDRDPSADHKAICSACAEMNRPFLAAAYEEAKRSRPLQ